MLGTVVRHINPSSLDVYRNQNALEVRLTLGERDIASPISVGLILRVEQGVRKCVNGQPTMRGLGTILRHLHLGAGAGKLLRACHLRRTPRQVAVVVRPRCIS
jgi:hypothetical protein